MRLTASNGATLLCVVLLAAIAAQPIAAAAEKSASRRELSDGGGGVQTSVVGGGKATKGRYPWMVSLRYNDKWSQHFCGASLIAPRIVMTAAHCVMNNTGNVLATDGRAYPQVRIGGWETDGGAYEKHQVVATLPHKDYDPSTNDYDIALLLLDKPSKKKAVKLVASQPDPPLEEGATVRAIGWGATRENGPGSADLQEVALDFLSLDTCAAYYPNSDWESNTQICAGSAGAGKDTCQGDSGGPLFVKGATAAGDKQVGIVSWGYGCARVPGVYTDVAMMRPWITQASAAMLAADKQKKKPTQ